MKQIIILLFVTNICFSQNNYFFKTNNVQNAIVKLDGDAGNLPLDQIPNPFEYGIKKGTKLDFILPKDSISFVLDNDVTIKIARKDKNDTLKIIFKSVKIVTFDNAFVEKNNQKIAVTIPEVYELVNVLIAISETGIKDENMINNSTGYYKKVQNYFIKYKNGKAVKMVNDLLKDNKYYELKMDSYSFVFDKNKIIPNPNYHVINWSNVNSISIELLTEIQNFSKKSNFRKFFKNNVTFYKSQENFIKTEINVSKMVNWLKNEFPTTNYNFYNIIFSPLVYGNQSTNNFSDNNFKEAQLHINFPYEIAALKLEFPKSYSLYRGNILFTELNHNFINPEAEKHKVQIEKVFTDLSIWERKNSPASTYGNALSCFEEYMNWALVTLYLYDNADRNEFETIKKTIENKLEIDRGFAKFSGFNSYLLEKYKSKKPTEKIAEFYPNLINWFELNK